MKVVLASSNVGKIKEFNELLDSFHLEVVPQSSLGVTDADETGLTFVENALIKARHATEITGLPALADDSGLSVDALHGEPGIYSARYAGHPADAKANIDKLLKNLEAVPDDKRSASFHCVLVFMTDAHDPTPLICHGIWKGVILREPRGTEGFGYDPVFFVPSQKKTAAELSPTLKNSISHRGQAMLTLLKMLPEKIGLV